MPPIHPCGMAICRMRHPVKVPMWFWRDRPDKVVIVQWYFVPDDAPDHPFPGPFVDRCFRKDDEIDWHTGTIFPRHLGELYYGQRRRTNGLPPLSAPPHAADRPCGTESQWLDGSVWGVDLPVPVNDDLQPLCCGAPRQGRRGIGLGGEAPVETNELMFAAQAFGNDEQELSVGNNPIDLPAVLYDTAGFYESSVDGPFGPVAGFVVPPGLAGLYALAAGGIYNTTPEGVNVATEIYVNSSLVTLLETTARTALTVGNGQCSNLSYREFPLNVGDVVTMNAFVTGEDFISGESSPGGAHPFLSIRRVGSITPPPIRPRGGPGLGGTAPLLGPIRPSGGIAVGGTAPASNPLFVTPGGGFALGGTAPVESVPPAAGSGGFALGGTAPVEVFVPTYGGFACGGTAPHSNP